MRRTAPVARLALIATVALLGLTGVAACGTSGGSEDTTDLAWDSQALVSIGYTTEDVGTAVGGTDDPTATDRPHRRFARLRYAFRHNTLHGEAVVKTDEGTKTVVVQRGTVKAVDGTSVTVESTDGFTLTWKAGDPLTVIVDRKKSDLSAITVGTTVGLAGARDGGTTTARLIVVPKKS